jgi:hypothetical protein
MPVYNNLKAIRRLTTSSLTSIIDITNLNFKSLSDANLEFLNNIQYNETLNTFVVYKGTFDFVDITDTLRLTLDGIPTFTIDSLGRAEGQELLVKVAETKRLRFTDFNDWPDIGVPGEVIYTGIQNQRPEFGEDFIGYLQTRGWVSLTDGAGAGYITLTMLESSPPIPPCPGQNQGTLWVAPPGYETAYVPTTQTLYYTDENCNVFDLATDFIWEKIGNDGKFKLPGKVIIGDSVDVRQLMYVDGTQSAGYVLTSDAFGNASWQPSSGGGGGGSCSYIAVQTFTANVPLQITHNLGTTNIIVQTIDIATNELIDGYIDNYQANSVELTFTQTLQVKVVILAACSGGGGGGSDIVVSQEGTDIVDPAGQLNFTGPGVLVTDAGGGQSDIAIGTKNNIRVGDVITISPDYQYMVYGNLQVEGIVNNYGELVIINGTPIVLPGGQINNISLGMIKVINLATGDTMQSVVRSFTTTAGVPITITHSLNSIDFTYTVRDNLTLIDVDIVIINANSIQLTTTSNVTTGSIVFQSKI